MEAALPDPEAQGCSVPAALPWVPQPSLKGCILEERVGADGQKQGAHPGLGTNCGE
jgi:hypothetical protein